MVKKEKNMIEKGLEELEELEELGGLEGSVMKWTRIVEEMKSGNNHPVENGSDDCPLCQLYHPSIPANECRKVALKHVRSRETLGRIIVMGRHMSAGQIGKMVAKLSKMLRRCSTT
jgi:hypothetical protein